MYLKMQVQINFLPVGHIHEDVDQLFSRIGDEIRTTGCESLTGKCALDHSIDNYYGFDLHAALLDLFARSSTPSPVATLISCVWDAKELLQPYLEPLEGHSRYAVFRFTLNSEGKSEMHYKASSDKPWEPKEAGLQLLSVRDCILYAISKLRSLISIREHLILVISLALKTSISPKWTYQGCDIPKYRQ